MHLLAATTGLIADGGEAVDLLQTPGEIVILSAADSDLACLANAQKQMGPESTSLRLANLMQLSHNMSVDLYTEKIVSKASLVIVRLIGGVSYWPYGLEQIRSVAIQNSVALIVIPGDDNPDLELMAYSTLPSEVVNRCWLYLLNSGVDNALNLLRYSASLLGKKIQWKEPAPLLKAGFYFPKLDFPGLDDIEKSWLPERPIIMITFYRALMQAGNLKAINSIIHYLGEMGFDVLPIYVSSLKDIFSAELIKSTISKIKISVILNTTSFAASKIGLDGRVFPFEESNCPVIQIILAGSDRETWEQSSAGLSARDIAMNVALPEVDGRLISRAISFKSGARYDALTECPIVTYDPHPDRIAFSCKLAANWARLGFVSPNNKRVAIILSNYPNKDGRIGNGVGLDTPASAMNILRAMKKFNYNIQDLPPDTESLMEQLIKGPTNKVSENKFRKGQVRFSLNSYQEAFSRLSSLVQSEITMRWGSPETDPFVVGSDFILPIHLFGNVVVAVQPARGYNIDPKETYHDQALVPPHGYMAFYAWLRETFQVHALVHLGKHGNLEWLPGKSIALSENCYPEASLGPVPNIYPFIVNDPGEGTQAKRRAAATIIDHLTPPLARAETYGQLVDLENLLDEYYQAINLDPRRVKALSEKILELAGVIKIDSDSGMDKTGSEVEKLQKLDAYLCDLKEMQIRDGLHILGESPDGDLLDNLLVALLRVPRASDSDENASIIRALAFDLDLNAFDPLDCNMSESWSMTKPKALMDILPNIIWRSCGDTVERLELLAKEIVSKTICIDPTWKKTESVLRFLEEKVRPSVLMSGPAELNGVLKALDGKFIPSGPSGAPTRGRLDVLPTGRNFYSVDTRSIPTPTAWQLGWKSAGLVLERHLQDHGEWPKTITLSAWGTANMRTGGDDIAQALAFLGVSPEWEPTSGRVTGFNILPLSVLDRPRVDVTFRISGFFRDAFPYQIDLLDSAIKAVAALDEPREVNPLAWTFKDEVDQMKKNNVNDEVALRRASIRIFGSKPGSYGAGMQALIDEGIWERDADFAETYLHWGSFAYGTDIMGSSEKELFRARLETTEVVLQNQDNREHDILDSDDYYQFQGGLSASVRHYSGKQPVIYHGDHSKPETPKIRTLEEEIGRVVRGRAVNPKWIKGIMRHGYKGAFEMAATVDYLFAFAATSRCVSDHHFDSVFEAYLEDPKVREFLSKYNSEALIDIATRLMEAKDRGLWRPSRNSISEKLSVLTNGSDF